MRCGRLGGATPPRAPGRTNQIDGINRPCLFMGTWPTSVRCPMSALRGDTMVLGRFVRNNGVLTSPRTKRIGGQHSVESQK
jgi:hypothetical protein